MSLNVVREQTLNLISRKDDIEKEIRELTTILTQNGIGMNDPLVDNEGYPLNTIDIYQVRNARHRIICLQNDHKSIMKQIENGLSAYYSNNSETISQDVNMDMDRLEVQVHKIPFANITLVSASSPAAYAGFIANDQIVEFGSVNSTNFKNITDIATVVQHSEGSRINVKLKRGDHYITVVLVPKKWNGRGLLGCNIAPL